MRGARREHPPKWGCDRRATKQMARRRPAPRGWGSLACWLRCSLLTDRCGYARRSRLASKPKSRQQNRNLFLNGPLGVRQRITVRISAFDRPKHFQDVMIRGAFKSMVHDHEFSEQPAGTLMSDRFEFKSPFGILGRIVDSLFLASYMRGFLVRR